MIFKDINIRGIKREDIPYLEHWRRQYWDADLEIPHGFQESGLVDTAVAEKNGQIIASLTGLKAVILDPLIHKPDMDHLDLVASIYLLERSLTYLFQRGEDSVIDSYIAVPNSIPEYHKIVMKAGYEPTVQNCTVYRRALKPEIMPRLGDERAIAEAKEKEVE